MDDPSQLPDPPPVSSPEQMVDALRALRLWAGQPSLRQLRRFGGMTTDRAGRQIDALPEATTAYVLRGDRQPRARFVRAFVAACLRVRGWREPQLAQRLERWHRAWLSATGGPSPAADPAASPAAASPPLPRQLPVAPGAFVGREECLTALDALLPPATGQPVAATLCVIEGSAGVGKTALAIYWAHRVRDRFPGGQLYLDLRGYASAEPLPPAVALAALLRALGIANPQLPADPQEAAALYRSLLAERPTLVVLDNAMNAEQVRPLLPGNAACLTLVTSRGQLASLTAREGARRIPLDVLTPADSRRLLAALLGPEAVAPDPAAADELAAACAQLPLALRVAGAHIAYHPPHRISDYLAKLRAGRPLEVLRIPGEPAPVIPIAFDLSYARLNPDSRRMFRRSALAPGPDLSIPAAAALTAGTAQAAQRELDTLVAAHLLWQPAAGRYTYHDLLRSYAHDRLQAEETSAERQRARDRLHAYYLVATEAATRVLHPQALRLPRPTGDVRPDPAVNFPDPTAALAWLDAERATLVAVVNQAAADASPVAWLLASLLPAYLTRGNYLPEAQQVALASRRTAAAAGDLPGEAIAWLIQAGVAELLSRRDEAIAAAGRARALSQAAGWDDAQAAALRSLGVGHWLLGELRQAIACHHEALRCYQRLGSRHGQAAAANSLGVVYLELGELAAAAEYANLALEANLAAGAVYDQAANLATLGQIYLEQPDLRRAHQCFTGSEWRFRQLDATDGLSNAWRGQAAVHRDTGEPTEALRLAEAALAAAGQTGNQRLQAAALATLASIQALIGDPAAVDSYRQGLALAQATRSPYQEVIAAAGLARALSPRNPHEATRLAEHALRIACTAGYRLLAQRARSELAAARRAVGGGVPRPCPPGG